jgi:hypothetical protein
MRPVGTLQKREPESQVWASRLHSVAELLGRLIQEATMSFPLVFIRSLRTTSSHLGLQSDH